MARTEGPASPCGPVGREQWWFVPVPDQPGQWFRVRRHVVNRWCPKCQVDPGIPCRRAARASGDAHLENKWETGAPREDLYVPEVAALVVVRTMRRIQRWHRAGSWRALNRIYAGHREEWRSERWCERLAQRGVDCRRPISKLGTKLGTAPEPGQRLWVARMALGGV